MTPSRTILLAVAALAVAAAAVTAGLAGVGLGSEDEPASPLSQDDLPANNSTAGNVTGTFDYGFTLTWTQVRYAGVEEKSPVGSNCVFVDLRGTDEVDRTDVTVDELEVHADWTGDAVSPVEQLDATVRDRDSEERFHGTVDAPLNATLPGWNVTTDDPGQYGLIFFWAPEDPRPKVEMEVEFHLYIDYTVPVATPGEDLFTLFTGGCGSE